MRRCFNVCKFAITGLKESVIKCANTDALKLKIILSLSVTVSKHAMLKLFQFFFAFKLNLVRKQMCSGVIAPSILTSALVGCKWRSALAALQPGRIPHLPHRTEGWAAKPLWTRQISLPFVWIEAEQASRPDRSVVLILTDLFMLNRIQERC